MKTVIRLGQGQIAIGYVHGLPHIFYKVLNQPKLSRVVQLTNTQYTYFSRITGTIQGPVYPNLSAMSETAGKMAATLRCLHPYLTMTYDGYEFYLSDGVSGYYYVPRPIARALTAIEQTFKV